MKTKEFAAAIGVAPTFLSSIIAGRYKLPTQRAETICKVFDINIDWLLLGKGKMSVWDIYNDTSALISPGGLDTIYRLSKGDKKRLYSLSFERLPENIRKRFTDGLSAYQAFWKSFSENKTVKRYLSERLGVQARFASEKYDLSEHVHEYYNELDAAGREDMLTHFVNVANNPHEAIRGW